MKRYRKYFQQILHQAFPATSGQLMQEIDVRFKILEKDIAFARHSANPMDKRLEVCAYFLAAIQALDSRGTPFARIRELLLAIAQEYVKPAPLFGTLLKRIPVLLLGSGLMTGFQRAYSGFYD